MSYKALILLTLLRLGASLPTASSSPSSLTTRSLRQDPKKIGKWPDSIVKWCFDGDDDDDLEELKEVVNGAWKLWSDALSGKSSLKWELADKDEPYCDEHDDDDRKKMLQITVNDDSNAEATMGYDEDEPNKLAIDLSDDYGASDPKVNLAHEMGHVIGLYHEHQRPLAWKNDKPLLKLNCKSMDVYDDFKKSRNDEQMDKLCKDRKAAADAKFPAAEFLPYGDDEGVGEGDFDWKSIMLYSSKVAGKGSFLGREKVLVKADGGDIDVNKKPSDGDVNAVAKIYPK